MTRSTWIVLSLLAVVAVGAAGAADWTEEDLPMDFPVVDLTGVVTLADGEGAYAVGRSGAILSRQSGLWVDERIGEITADLFDVTSVPGGDPWAVSGQDTLYINRGGVWDQVSEFLTGPVRPIWLTPGGESLWAFVPDSSFPVVCRYNTDDLGPLFACAGFSPEAGENLLGFCGTEGDVTYAFSDGNVYRVVDNALGSPQTVHTSPVDRNLAGLWWTEGCGQAFGIVRGPGSTPPEVWRFTNVGDGVWNLFYDGFPATDELFWIGGSSSANLYAVGIDGSSNGVIWEYAGGWTLQSIPAGPGLGDVSAVSGSTRSPEQPVFITTLGDQGIIFSGDAVLFDTVCPSAVDCSWSGLAGDPVSTRTGELVLRSWPDVDLGGPLPVRFRRSYASELEAAGRSGRIGPGWRHSFEWELEVDGSDATVLTPEGRQLRFAESGGAWTLVDPLDVPYQLLDDAGTWRLADPDRRLVISFDATPRVIEIADLFGSSLALSYTGADLTGVTDGLGRILVLSYDANGWLEQVTDGTRTVTFGHDPTDGRLTSVVGLDGETTTYAHDAADLAAGRITATTRPAGNVPWTQVYDADGLVIEQTDGDSNTTTFTY